MPSIVSVVVVSELNYYGMIEQAEGAGSGFIVGQNDTDLFIATNYHVIEDTTEIKVQFCDNQTIPAVVKGKNIAMDLAVLAISLDTIPQETRDVITIATIGDSDTLRVGEPAIAIGNAHGFYKEAPQLRFDILDKVAKTVDVPLVLHGGTGIEPVDFIRCHQHGIKKINIATATFAAAEKKVREGYEKGEIKGYYDLHVREIEGAYENAKKHMEIFYSVGKAE